MPRPIKNGNLVGNEHDAQPYIRAGQARSGLPLNFTLGLSSKAVL
jgi:hypothetical protein